MGEIFHNFETSICAPGFMKKWILKTIFTIFKLDIYVENCVLLYFECSFGTENRSTFFILVIVFDHIWKHILIDPTIMVRKYFGQNNPQNIDIQLLSFGHCPGQCLWDLSNCQVTGLKSEHYKLDSGDSSDI